MFLFSTLSPSTLPPVEDPSVLPQRPARSEAVLIPALLIAAVYAVPLIAAVRPIADPLMEPDIWWHLRVGQWICEHHTVPTTDPFSRFGADKPWVAYSWLYEVVVYGLYQTFGLAGIVIYRAGMSLAIVAMFHRLIYRRKPPFLVALGLTGIAALASTPLFSERPWLFTILFTTLTLDILIDIRSGSSTRSIWLLPFVFALWANLHIQFVYGFLLLGLACVSPWIDAMLGFRSSQTSNPDRRSAGRIYLVAGLCLAATLVNPYHVRLYGVVMEYATQPGPFRCVNELRALEFRETPDWVVLLLGASAIFVLGRRRSTNSFDLLLLAGAGLLAFHARRDIWFLTIASVVVLASAAAESLPGTGILQSSMKPSAACWGCAALMLIGVVAVVAWRRDLSEENLRRKVAGVFPVESVAFVSARDYEGPIFNDFNWGGFLIWSLPQFPVVLDGRTNLHGDERILRIGNTWAAGRGWRDDPDLSQAGIVLADISSPLGSVLSLDDRFELAHEDAVARVFIRKKNVAARAQCVGTATP
jgi:hypothetical protein